MIWRIATWTDRILAVILAVGIGAWAVDQGFGFELSPFLCLSLLYPALLAISTHWSLLLFALYSVPATCVAYVICDSSPGAGPWGIVHFFHDLMIPLVLYGLVRGIWEIIVAADREKLARKGNS